MWHDGTVDQKMIYLEVNLFLGGGGGNKGGVVCWLRLKMSQNLRVWERKET